MSRFFGGRKRRRSTDFGREALFAGTGHQTPCPRFPDGETPVVKESMATESEGSKRTGLKRVRSRRALVIEALFLMGLWLHLSGRFDPFHLALGVGSVLLVMWINAPLKQTQLYSGDTFAWDRANYWALMAYLPWLGWEILLGSIQVAYLVLHPRMPVKPCLIYFRVNLPNLAARVTLGNSITLTPGTVTIRIRGNEFVVHALTRESAESLVHGTMPLRISRIFNGPREHVVSQVRMVPLDGSSAN